MNDKFKVGQKVMVRRHKCGVDRIGPFETVIEHIDAWGIAEVTDPKGREWSVDKFYMTAVEEHGSKSPAKPRK